MLYSDIKFQRVICDSWVLLWVSQAFNNLQVFHFERPLWAGVTDSSFTNKTVNGIFRFPSDSERGVHWRCFCCEMREGLSKAFREDYGHNEWKGSTEEDTSTRRRLSLSGIDVMSAIIEGTARRETGFGFRDQLWGMTWIEKRPKMTVSVYKWVNSQERKERNGNVVDALKNDANTQNETVVQFSQSVCVCFCQSSISGWRIQLEMMNHCVLCCVYTCM